ncbi:MAG: hypothetical protein MJ252_23050 [archaeon]|nr:hypothetical protein [archaeon]
MPDINGDPEEIKRRFQRRLKAYKALNESEKGEPNLTNFCKENNIEMISVNGGKEDESKVLEKCKVFVERNGKILNYQIFDEEVEKVEKKEVVQKIGNKKTKGLQEEIENEFYDNEKDEVKKLHNKEKSEQLAQTEKKMLEKKSEILKRYLSENVIPVLSKGILHVCKELPEDPVDELAHYLFNNSFNAKFPPQKYFPQQEQ